ncbi:MAG: nitrous oxide reductase family maturation protein NosD [Candidatus Bathyarchaeia archaeon]
MTKNISKVTTVLAILVLSMAGLQAVRAESKVITVPTDYSSIQEAISNAASGDTIFVKKGVYVENPVVNKSVSLIGEDMETTVIDVTAGMKVESNNVTVEGFTIYDGWRGITLTGNYCSISGNKITDATNGIVLFGCEGCSITSNIFESIGLSSAIQLNYAYGNRVSNNYIDSCVEGIQIWQTSRNNSVTENTIINCQDHAIRFQYSNENTVVLNNITRSGCGTSIYGSNGNKITNNNYCSNTFQFSANEDYYLTFGHNRSINTISENYWSDYNGTDGNQDGKGDTPYIIDDNNQDDYPLMTPVNLSTASIGNSPSASLLNPTPSIPELPFWTALPLMFALMACTALLAKRKRQKPYPFCKQSQNLSNCLKKEKWIHKLTAT